MQYFKTCHLILYHLFICFIFLFDDTLFVLSYFQLLHFCQAMDLKLFCLVLVLLDFILFRFIELICLHHSFPFPEELPGWICHPCLGDRAWQGWVHLKNQIENQRLGQSNVFCLRQMASPTSSPSRSSTHVASPQSLMGSPTFTEAVAIHKSKSIQNPQHLLMWLAKCLVRCECCRRRSLQPWRHGIRVCLFNLPRRKLHHVTPSDIAVFEEVLW